ncbi:MAG: hypothetical protein K1000chlam2_01770 [Chlamydiae bacterium]|nr:hypothetical protein [Chlamydiota bacterium]
MIALNRYDWKQIRLIEKKLILFENKKIGLFDLITDLDGLLNTLETVADSWKDNFRSGINSLEIIYDSIEDGSISKWRGNFEEDLHKSVLKLKKMVMLLLEEYLKISDSNVSEVAIEGDSKWFICPNCNDAWESMSSSAMIVCPKCERVCHNPRARGK